MNKKMVKGFRGIAIILFSASLLAGCGSSGSAEAVSTDSYAVNGELNSYSDSAGATVDNASLGGMDTKSAMSESATGTESETGTESTTVSDSSKKLITTVNLDAETEDMDTLLTEIDSEVTSLGGYIESSSVTAGSDSMQEPVTYGSDTDYSYKYESRDAYLTLRIPADSMEDFLGNLGKNCNITSQSKNVQDVTLEYVDTKSHVEALEAELKQLNAIMEKAQTVDEIIAVEDKITDVQYQLDSIKSQLKVYDNQIDYSTINVSLTEVKTYTAKSSGSIWSEISEGFVDSIKAVGNGILSFIIWFIIHIPQIVLICIIAFVIIIVIKKRRKHVKKDKKTDTKDIVNEKQ